MELNPKNISVMKNVPSKIVLGSLILVTVFSCKKGEIAENQSEIAVSKDAAAVSDSISYAASQKIPDRKFVKTADVNMEVKDVYDATIFIENQLKNLGGFVTHSEIKSNIISDETYNTSDDKAILLRKYQTDNSMTVRVPSERLGEFLTFVNDKKLFLNTRIIHAEDVTNNSKIAQLEISKAQKTGEVIEKMKNNEKKVELTNENLPENNAQQIANITLADDLKYSAVAIYLKEPKIRVAEIPVTNTKYFDNKYQINFAYEAKTAILSGFYMVQKMFVFLLNLWPFLLIGGAVYYFLKKRKMLFQKTGNE